MNARQLSFSSGEIAPALYARCDLLKYATGLKTCLNFLVMRHGGTQNRPGTQFITEVKTSSNPVRTLPFIFNTDQTYVLEFGDLYMRVIKDGVLLESSPGVPYELVTPYVEADLATLSFAQSADVVTIVHPNYAPRDLSRTGDTTWSLDVIVFGPTIGTPTNLASSAAGTTHYYQVTAVDAKTNEEGLPSEAVGSTSETSTLTWDAVDGAGQYNIYKLLNGAYGFIGVAAAVESGTVFSVTSLTHGLTIPDYKIATATTSVAHGLSTGDLVVIEGADQSVYNGVKKITVTSTTTFTYTLSGYRLLDSPTTPATGTITATAVGGSFKDATYTPDMLDLPPEARTPFDDAGNYPSAVVYFQQRLIFANTNNYPESVWASRSGLRKNFMISTPLQDDDAVTFQLAGLQVQSVRHMLEAGKLILFTSSGEWTVEGDVNGVLTPTAINVKQYTGNGSGSLRPLLVTGSALYVQSRGSVVRDLTYQWEAQGYRGNEVSIFASHLFDGHTLVDWAYQQIPQSIVWAVRDDGVLLGLTYVREHLVTGWHRHTVDGVVENVCVVPEGSEDTVYLVVLRNINGVAKRYHERMFTRQISDIRDAVFLDCALTYDGRNTSATSMTLSGGTTWVTTEDLVLTASTGFFTAADVGNEMWLTDPDGSGELRCRITAYTSDQVVTVRPNKTVPVSLRAVSVVVWSRAVDQVTGLEHLEGKDVSVFSDGNVLASPNNPSYDPQEVATGALTLAEPHAVIHVGLPITADLETLNLDTAQGPSLADKKKQVSRVTIFAEASRGIFAGVSADRLTELKIRNEENYDDPIALLTGTATINLSGEWNDNGRVLIRQVDPLPLSVLAIVPSGYLAV